jgi:hypothetical protein
MFMPRKSAAFLAINDVGDAFLVRNLVLLLFTEIGL